MGCGSSQSKSTPDPDLHPGYKSLHPPDPDLHPGYKSLDPPDPDLHPGYKSFDTTRAYAEQSAQFTEIPEETKAESKADNVNHTNMSDAQSAEDPQAETDMLIGALSATPVAEKLPIVTNEYTAGAGLPEPLVPTLPETRPCTRGFAWSKWPIACLVKLDGRFNVNAGAGGCAGLVQISNSYGAAGCDTTCQLLLLRCGYDGNYHSVGSLAQSHAGHFGVRNCFEAAEDGELYPDCMFGNNNVNFITNDPHHGNLSHGLVVEGGEEGEPCTLPLNANGASGGGSTLVLCHADAGEKSAVYMLRSGHKENNIQSSVVKGDDEWKYDCSSSGEVSVTGPAGSRYAMFHNRVDNVGDKVPGVRAEGPAAATHAQSMNGAETTTLFDGSRLTSGCVGLVLCSNNSGVEDATSAAIYFLTLSSGWILKAELVKDLIGHGYSGESGDGWKFEVKDKKLLVTGPEGPCRYAFMSNVIDTEHKSSGTDLGCLASGQKDTLAGVVKVDESEIVGWVSAATDIVCKKNEKDLFKFPTSSLKSTAGKYAFSRSWKPSEKDVGLHLIRVFAVRKHAKGGGAVEVELPGSPRQVIYQPPGVEYTLNCGGGQAYQALNDLTFTSEFSQFANFDKDYVFGTRCKALGKEHSIMDIPQLLGGTDDGDLYVRARNSGPEAEDEQKIIYEVPNIKNGKYFLRIHAVSRNISSLIVNGNEISSKYNSQMKSQRESIPGYSAGRVEVPMTVKTGRLTLNVSGGNLSALELTAPGYREKVKSAAKLEAEKEEKKQLVDKIEPLSRVMVPKKLQIVGWSQNLLQNASGEARDMSHWNYGGSWETQEGGHGTEYAFVTSHMHCTKYQEVLLLDHFTAEHLDTAPEIQVSEWYKEGVCGGGHYLFTATVLSADGQTLAKYESTPTGRIYRDHAWTEEKAVFKDYGKGARSVGLQSMGHDDKNWGGHYGAIMSASVIRVKRDVEAVEDDAFEDVGATSEESQSTHNDRVVNGILAENQELLDELMEEQVLPTVDDVFHHEMEAPSGGIKLQKRRRQKKREVRLFVSSTFRDFKQEREQLIKKTFREINGFCANRGVFFTYVDLRWGITEKQTSHGQTIAICLQEIARCRPYFVCLMGERYGWSQSHDRPDSTLNESFDYAIRNFPKEMGWVEEFRYGGSVTLLEILHGVLNDVGEHKARSFFYVRTPMTTADGTTDLSVFEAESAWHKEKQTDLRSKITGNPQLHSSEYSSTEEVCDSIKKDMTRCIDEDFPLGTELTALEREREAHVAFADARRRVYIGREEYFTQIDEYMATHHTTPLVLLGESGSGKSALVANWVGRYEDREAGTFVFFHFIGSSAESASHIKLLRRLYEELRAALSLDQAVPSTDSGLVQDLPLWLTMAGSRARCVIVLDALNQLNDGSGTEGSEQDLLWLPRELPAGIHMLVSTLPGRALGAMQGFGWPTMQVAPLQQGEKMDIVTGYLEGIYGKTLSADQKEMLVEAQQTTNPLYLKALLDEVRVYGNFRKLTEKIREYLQASSPGDLFAKILERLEDDFEKGQHESGGSTSTASKNPVTKPWPGLVRETTSAIWCSHRGMTEAELLDLLQIPSAVWSPFYLSLVENLVNRNGVLNFFHDHLRQAVESKYLPTAEDKQRGYSTLADFFIGRDLDDRKVDELPFLLTQSRRLEELRTTVSDIDVFSRMVATEDSKFDLIKAWQLLGDYSEAQSAYMAAMDRVSVNQRQTDSFANLQQTLAEFFIDLGLYDTARSLLDQLLQQREHRYGPTHSRILYFHNSRARTHRCCHPVVIDLLHKLGEVCLQQGAFPRAHKYYAEAIFRQRRVDSPRRKLQLVEGLLGQAGVLLKQNDASEARKYLLRARELATQVLGTRHHMVAAIINKLGQLSYQQGRVEEALGYFLQDLSLTRGEVGTSHPRTACILNDIALVYDDRSDQQAAGVYEVALAILLETYGNNHLSVARVRYNLGACYFATSAFQRAKFQFTTAADILHKFLGGDHADTKEALTAVEDVSAFV